MNTAVAERSLHRDVISLRCLILNADGLPLSTFPPSIVSAQDAISALWRDRAFVVDTWEGAFFHSPSTRIAVPKTMMLRDYAPLSGTVKFSRRSLLLRDHFECQYCGKRFESQELSYDHVQPRAAGGVTCWENIVMACHPCNAAKADKLANHSGRKGVKGSLRPLKTPRRPTTAELMRAGMEFLPKDVVEKWSDWLYWDGELRV